MKLTVRPTSITDIHNVLTAPSEITQAELDAYHWTTWEAMAVFKGYLMVGQAHTLFEDDNPICIYGTFPHPTRAGVRNTWFITKDNYFKGPKRIHVFSRRWWREHVKRFDPDIVFETFSRSPHEDAGKWFEFMGFFKIPWPIEGELFYAYHVAKSDDIATA